MSAPSSMSVSSASSLAQAGQTAPTMRQVCTLALPQLGLMFCHMAIYLTDVWVAGRIDTRVLASLGVVGQIFGLLMLITSIAGSGCLAAISQALGADLPRRAERYAGLIVLLAGSAGSFVGLLGYCCLPLFLFAVRVPEELVPVVRIFVGVYCLNLPFYYTLILINSIFRAHKLVRLPLLSFSVVLGVNLIGSLGLGLGWFGLPHLGYAGVAWSTLFSTLTGLMVSICSVRRHGIISHRAFAPWRWNRRAFPYLLKVGGPSVAGQLVAQGAGFIKLGLIASLPEAINVMAGMTLGVRVHSVLMFPLGAVNLTMAIFAGHMLGAGARQELYRFGLRTACGAAAVFGSLAVIVFLAREPAAALLSTDPEAIREACRFLLFALPGVPALACVMTLSGILSGSGATVYYLALNLLSLWAVQLPLAWFLGHRMGYGADGIYAAMLVAEGVYVAAFMKVYCSRKWLEFGMQRRKHAG